MRSFTSKFYKKNERKFIGILERVEVKTSASDLPKIEFNLRVSGQEVYSLNFAAMKVDAYRPHVWGSVVIYGYLKGKNKIMVTDIMSFAEYNMRRIPRNFFKEDTTDATSVA